MQCHAIQKRILRNWAKLFTGSTVGAGLGLLATILMTRTISVADVGIVVVIQTFWRTLEGFLSFQSFQVLIKHGADILHGKSGGSLPAVIRICMLADGLMALFGAAVGMWGMDAYHTSVHIPSDVLPYGLLGAATMLTMVTGAHLGILRLFDKFAVVAARDVVVGVLRVALNLAAFLAGWSLYAFICIWIATEALGNAMIVWYGFRELRARGYTAVFRVSAPGDAGFNTWPVVKALFTVNAATMLRVLTEEGDTLLVTVCTGAIAAGKYKIAKNFANIVYRFTGPLAQSVYPELARAVSERNRAMFKSIFIHITLQGGLLGLAAFAGWAAMGHWLIAHTVGPTYQDALALILIITGGYAAGFFGIGVTSTLYAFNMLNQYLAIAVLCTLAYFATALPLLTLLGPAGSAWGQVACYVSALVAGSLACYHAYRRYPWAP
jgi:O-antigen/teichoic acid export membrane protein